MNEAQRNVQERKRQLIAQGALLRAEIVHARLTAQAGLRPDSLARRALARLAGIAAGGLGGAPGMLAAVNWRSALPVVLSGASAVLRKMRQPSPASPHATPRRYAWRIGLAVGGLAAVAALAFKAKRARRAAREGGNSAPDLPEM